MIVVAGSLNLDLIARVPRLPAAGETVIGHTLTRHHGGKGGNQAVAAARLGADVAFHGAVGDDDFGAALVAALRADGVHTAGVVHADGPSGSALVQVADDGGNTISVLPGANGFAPGPPPQWPPEWRWLLLQLEIPLPTVMAWADAARRAGVPVLLNAAPAVDLPPALMQAVDLLLVNESELATLGCESIDAAATLGPRRVVVTLGARGSVAWDGGRRLAQAPHDVWMVDSTGAGDTFAGALVASLDAGRGFEEALTRAGVAAALACTQLGAREGMPTLAALESALAGM